MPPRSRFINVDFDPNLEQVEQDFVRLGRSFENKRQVMLAAEAVARQDINEMFEGEHDADGDPWAYWKTTPPPGGSNLSYAERAQEYPNIGILQQTGDLRTLATSQHQFVISGNHLSYGHDLPEWAGVHLHGGVTANFNDGYVIPQRSFYPYSREGVVKVQRLFDAWAAHNVEIMERTSKRGRTYVQIQTRTPSGQFGPSPL